MDLTTKIILIIASVLIIGGLCFTLIYYRDDIFGERITSTTTTEVSTITQGGMPEEVTAFVNSITALDSEVVEVIKELNDLMAKPQISDQNWRDEMYDVKEDIIYWHNYAKLIHVPTDSTAKILTDYVNNVTSNLKQAAIFIVDAIEETNSETKGEFLENAIVHMAEIEDAREDFFIQLNIFVASYN